ncbi:hypothetical protein ACTFIY_012625 [Dictyostelium cf. discoideum]
MILVYQLYKTGYCVLNDTIRIYTLPVKDSDREQMYSEELFACTERSGTFVDSFPSPLLISPFKPKTRGGNTTLSGYYLELKERVYVVYENDYEQDQYYGAYNFYKVLGGILTIIGNDFYYPIDKVTIIGSSSGSVNGNSNGNDSGNCSDFLNCNEPKYINYTMITCFIQATNYTFNNTKNGEMIFINVTTNGKSGTSKVFKYLIQSDDSHQYSDARIIFQNLLPLIILIISLLFISNI